MSKGYGAVHAAGDMMPITRQNGKWYWGSQGPFPTRAKAEQVARAAHASGYKGKRKKRGK